MGLMHQRHLQKVEIWMNKGNSAIIILVVLAIAIVGGSAFAFYMLKGSGSLPGYSPPYTTTVYPTPSAEVSQSADLNTIEQELNATQEGSVDTEIKELETSAASL